MTARIDKTISRLQQRIQEGQYYEAHQQLRVVTARYVKQQNWSAAVDILHSGAQALLKKCQYGSGADLCRLLVTVLQQAEQKPDSGSKAKLISLLRMFPPEEPGWKRFADEAIAWSIKTGECPLGDADLHQAIGELYTQEPNPYDAERHLVLGTSSAPEHLANLEYDWYTADEAHTAPFYISRAVLAYLLVGNLRDSARSMQIFLDRLVHDKSSIGIQDMKVGGVQAKIISSMPLMNFLNLLLLAVPRGRAESFRQLRKHYSGHLRDLGGWEEVLDHIGEMYFGIPIRRQTNPLFDMMGSLLGGGGQGPPQPSVRRIDPPAPPAVDLD